MSGNGNLGGKVVAAEIRAQGSSAIERGALRELFDSIYYNAAPTVNYFPYSVSVDGQRFLIPRDMSDETSEAEASSPITVVLNWTAMLKK